MRTCWALQHHSSSTEIRSGEGATQGKGSGNKEHWEKAKKEERMAAQLLKDMLGMTKPSQRGLYLYSDLHIIIYSQTYTDIHSPRKWSVSRRSWTLPRPTPGLQWEHQGLHFVHPISGHRGKEHSTGLLRDFLATCHCLEEDWGITIT